MFPSYKTIVSRNSSLFETNPLNGLTISQSFRFSPAILTYAINLPYLKVPFMTDKFGQKHAIDPVTRIFQSSIILPYPKFQMILGFGSIYSAQVSYTPQPWINFSSSIQTNSPPLTSVSMSNSFSNITLVFNPSFSKDWNANIFLSGGLESLYACAQLSHEIQDSSNSNTENSLISLNSFLIGHQKNDFKCQWLILGNNKDILANVISIQNSFKNYKDKVPYVDLGFALQFSRFEKIDGTIAWKTEINGCTIHSLIKSSGVVQSTFKMKPNSVCDMIVSGKLDHKACDYTLGLSLNFL